LLIGYLLLIYLLQSGCEEAEVDAERTVSQDKCEEPPQPCDEPPQPKPRKKKKAVKKTGNWLFCFYRFLLLYA